MLVYFRYVTSYMAVVSQTDIRAMIRSRLIQSTRWDLRRRRTRQGPKNGGAKAKDENLSCRIFQQIVRDNIAKNSLNITWKIHFYNYRHLAVPITEIPTQLTLLPKLCQHRPLLVPLRRPIQPEINGVYKRRSNSSR